MAVTDHAFSLGAQGGNYLKKGEWLGAVSYRWLHADSLFVGTDALPLFDPSEYREFHFIDVHATYMMTKRLSLGLTLPFKHAESFMTYQHDFWPKHGLSISLGGRVEGIPVHDLIGGSGGYRGAGYVVSIEPGFAWSRGRNTITLSAPVAVERNRQASVPNRRAGVHYGADFADFFIQAAFLHRF